MNSGTLDVIDLGRRPYRDVLDIQRAMRLARIDGTLAHDTLLLVEHDPVFTLGRGTHASSLPLSEAELRERGADVIEIERGGDVTWHGPGQLVGYPIIDLTRHRQDLHWYLRTLEQTLIDALGRLGIVAGRNPGKTGVWTRNVKIASIGIHVKQWVTLHGFALNVDPDLGWFDLIVPCGISGVVMTSVARELGPATDGALSMRTRDAVVDAFGRAFAFEVLSSQALPSRLASANVQA
ncbi:MAG TPA: lipoyl(octanoyl) transferase LipB [Gemmatimonadales bacterium]|nr:lipoyl(octanoyl) transferase LipB [Gemmatimonadales bacterium]